MTIHDKSSPDRRSDGTMLKGHSANPKGRPPRSRNMLTLFNEKRDEKVSIKVDGAIVKMTRLEAWVTNLWNRAITVDPKASATVLAVMRASGQLDPAPDEKSDLSANDAAVLDALIGRLDKTRGGGRD